jgi:hypothetical protein
VDRSRARFLHTGDNEIYLLNLSAPKRKRFHVRNSTTFRATRKLDRQFARNG